MESWYDKQKKSIRFLGKWKQFYYKYFQERLINILIC